MFTVANRESCSRVHGISSAPSATMITALLITLAIVAGGLITEMIAAANAPFGYQDESGFHFGQEHKLRGEDSGNPS